MIALKRFIARRGRPLRIYSDNGTNFVSANNALLKFLKQLNEEKVQNFCEPKEIEQNFQPPRAPHFGGAWERLGQCAKKKFCFCEQIRVMKRLKLVRERSTQRNYGDSLKRLSTLLFEALNQRAYAQSYREEEVEREEKESEGRRRSACCRTEPATKNVAFGQDCVYSGLDKMGWSEQSRCILSTGSIRDQSQKCVSQRKARPIVGLETVNRLDFVSRRGAGMCLSFRFQARF